MEEPKPKIPLTKKQIIIIGTCIVLVGGLFLLSLFFANPNKKTESPTGNLTTNTTTPESSMAKPPINAQVKIATLGFQQKTATSTAILLDTGNKAVSAVQLEIAFDSSAIHNVRIQPGKFFEKSLSLISNVDYQNGSIFYVIAIPPTGYPKEGRGEIATLYYDFNNGAFNPTTLKFLPKTKVAAAGIDDSVLKTANPANIASQ